ncbi:MAG: sortase, partial [Nitriliruptoraceae bacterium]
RRPGLQPATWASAVLVVTVVTCTQPAKSEPDGSTVTFVIEGVEQHPKDELPGGQVWAASDEPRLTLITCGGVFDRTTGHYTDNAIVYTTLAR